MMIEAGFFPWGETAFAMRLASVGDRGGPAQIAGWQSQNVHDLKAVNDEFQNNATEPDRCRCGGRGALC